MKWCGTNSVGKKGASFCGGDAVKIAAYDQTYAIHQSAFLTNAGYEGCRGFNAGAELKNFCFTVLLLEVDDS